MFRKFALVVALVVVPTVAHATTVTSFGPRFGFSVDPDQLVLGGQLETREIARDLTFVPNLELGFGDDVTVIAANFDFHYGLTIPDSDWRPYFGFGIGVNFVNYDRPFPYKDGSDTEVGGNLILGSNIPAGSSSFFAEMKLGLGDIPTLKVLGGWRFPMGR